MKKGKLEILADIQTEFENSTMREINLSIFLLRTLKFLNSKLFAFILATACIATGMFVGSLCGAKWSNMLSPLSLIINVVIHIVIFTQYSKKSEADLEKEDEENFSLECMIELKKSRIETK